MIGRLTKVYSSPHHNLKVEVLNKYAKNNGIERNKFGFKN